MAEDDYSVGYGKPPKATRWKKGESGNPRGRSKGSRGLKTDLHQELSTKLAIKINGKLVKGTTQQLMLRTLAARAASGDVRASRVLIDLILQVFGVGDRGGEREHLSAQDQALLEQWLGTGGSDPSEEADVEALAESRGEGAKDEPPASTDEDEEKEHDDEV